MTLLALEDGAGGHEPRSVSSLWKLQKARKQICPWSVLKEHSPADPLIVAQ